MPWRSWSARHRLDLANGHHDNQVIRVHFGGTGNATALAFDAMDRWLAAVESDPSATSLEQKIVNNKPADYNDACFNSATGPDVGFESPECLVKNTRSPHSWLAVLSRKHLQMPAQAAEFRQPGLQWRSLRCGPAIRLAAVFPTGVCDWTLLASAKPMRS